MAKRLTKPEAENMILHYITSWATLLCRTDEDYYHEGIPDSHCLDKTRCRKDAWGQMMFYPNEAQKKLIASQAEKIVQYLLKRKSVARGKYLKNCSSHKPIQ